MLQNMVIQTPNKVTTIKISSPKSDIKVYKANLIENPKIYPELTIRGSSNQNQNEDTDKVTQAINRLKISVLSKAIAIAPDVGSCTIGPNCAPPDEEESNGSDVGSTDKLNQQNVVTSTPVKSDGTSDKAVGNLCNKSKNNLFDVSEISPEKDDSLCSANLSKEIRQLESFRVKCLERIEAQIKRCAERKRSECMKVFEDHDMKIKEELAAMKIELDKERLVRLQEQYIISQKHITETKANELFKAQQLQQNQLDHDKRIAETSEKIRQIEQKRKELEEKQKKKREELKLCINGVYETQVAYNKKYNEITEITKKCRDLRMLNEKVSEDLMKLRTMNDLLLRLVEKSREGKVCLKDLKSAQFLVRQVSLICESFAKHVDQINQDIENAEEGRKKEQLENEERTKREEAEQQQKAKEEVEQKQQEKINKAERSAKLSAGIEDCISGESLKWHLQLTQYLEDYEDKLQPLLRNESLKKFRFECQKMVNVPVNAISPLDDIHLEDKLYKLSRLLRGQAVPHGNTLFLATGHPLGIPYCTNMLAKKFVKQGEHTVSSKPEAAFAIAAVIVALWADFPDFGRLLLAHFHRECPYLIPAFLPQVEGQTNEDYYKMLGYEYSEDGKVEPQDKFLRRMSGVMRLYAAILVTPLKRSQLAEGKTHPHSLREAWRWFAATLNLRPRPDISPTLIFDFLEVAGWLMYRAYGLQFRKLLQVLCADYFPLVEQVTPDGCGGPVVRLKSFLEKILKENQVPPPSGLLPPNFW